jgi:hypothetical protein
MEKRASYFFVLDVFIGSAILVLTLIIIFSSRVNSPTPDATFRMADDYIEFLASTEFRDFASVHRLELTKGGYVNDTTQSLLQVLAQLNYYQYSNGSVLWSTLLAQEITDGILPTQYGVNVSVNDTILYGPGKPLYSIQTYRPFKNKDARIELTSKRLGYVQIRNSDQSLAPVQFVVEVKVWA